jgi:hypothetical protein
MANPAHIEDHGWSFEFWGIFPASVVQPANMNAAS